MTCYALRLNRNRERWQFVVRCELAKLTGTLYRHFYVASRINDDVDTLLSIGKRKQRRRGVVVPTQAAEVAGIVLTDFDPRASGVVHQVAGCGRLVVNAVDLQFEYAVNITRGYAMPLIKRYGIGADNFDSRR